MARKKNIKDLDEFERGYIEAKMDCSTEIREANAYTNCVKALKYKVDMKCKNKKQKDFINILKNEKNQICFGVGSAGTGKSILSLYYALSALKDEESPYQKIIIIVPTVEAGNMELGFLRGGIEEKIAPYIEADSYTMEKILRLSGNNNPKQIVKDLIKSNLIQYELVNFARGKSFDNCIILINEAENYSKEEMLLLLTRIGDDCKVIVTGDELQLDRKDIRRSNNDCGLVHAFNKLMEFEEVDGVKFEEEDIVRNPLITKILSVY